jgi:sarcosine oxidase
MNAEQTYDTAVIGAGVFGAWTAYRLRESGQAVALLDGDGPAHSRASSGGESRIIRMGYGAGELYARWAARSLALWQDFFRQVGRAPLPTHGRPVARADGRPLHACHIPAS